MYILSNRLITKEAGTIQKTVTKNVTAVICRKEDADRSDSRVSTALRVGVPVVSPGMIYTIMHGSIVYIIACKMSCFVIMGLL